MLKNASPEIPKVTSCALRFLPKLTDEGRLRF